MKDRNKKELAEFLWLEINRAIINSNSVRNCLKILKQMDMLDFLCQHDYILDGRKLVEKLLDEPPREEDSIGSPESPAEHYEDFMETILAAEAAVPSLPQSIDFTKGKFTKQLIRAYGFCRN